MALYEYLCNKCGARFERRMSMSDVLQVVPCTACDGQARKTLGGFAVVGRAQSSPGDGPAPWESDGGGDDGGDADGSFGTHGHDHGGHGHSHGPGGHTH